MFHPKLNPHIGIEPPAMGTNTIIQHVQAIVSYLELVRLGNKISYVDALKKALQTFPPPYELIRTERLNIKRHVRYEEQLDECYQFKNIKTHLTSQIADLQRTANDEFEATIMSAVHTTKPNNVNTPFTREQKQEIAAIAESAFAIKNMIPHTSASHDPVNMLAQDIVAEAKRDYAPTLLSVQDILNEADSTSVSSQANVNVTIGETDNEATGRQQCRFCDKTDCPSINTNSLCPYLQGFCLTKAGWKCMPECTHNRDLCPHFKQLAYNIFEHTKRTSRQQAYKRDNNN
jgi:hypothetical protein